MSKTLKLNDSNSSIRAAVLTKELKRELKIEAAEMDTTVSEILRELVADFIDRFESEDFKDIAIAYCGKDIYTSKDTQAVTFRVENCKYELFCKYSLCIGNEPTELLRKLVMAFFNRKIAQYTLKDLDNIVS